MKKKVLFGDSSKASRLEKVYTSGNVELIWIKPSAKEADRVATNGHFEVLTLDHKHPRYSTRYHVHPNQALECVAVEELKMQQIPITDSALFKMMEKVLVASNLTDTKWDKFTPLSDYKYYSTFLRKNAMNKISYKSNKQCDVDGLNASYTNK